MPCRAHLAQLREHQEEFTTQNAKIVVVTFEAQTASRRYAEETHLAWPLLIDETREVYRRYGMLSASFWDVWGPRTWFVYFREMIKGQKLKKSDADVRQRGGDVLIDPNGVIRMHHVGEGPADRPDAEVILQTIHEWHGEKKADMSGNHRGSLTSGSCGRK